MERKDSNGDWFWLIVILLILGFLWLISQITKNTTVNNYRKYYKDKAETLKRKIKIQEAVVLNITTELNKVLSLRNYLVAKAKRIWFGIKCSVAVVIVGGVFLIHGIYTLSVVEVITAITGTVAFTYFIFSSLIWNEVKHVNDVLIIFQNTITCMVYRRYNFEPALIEALQSKLEYEVLLLERMKVKYQETISSWNNNK